MKLPLSITPKAYNLCASKVHAQKKKLLYIVVTSGNLVMDAGSVVFGTPRERSAFTVCICRVQRVTRYCGKKLSWENSRVHKLCDTWVLLVLCWQNFLDSLCGFFVCGGFCLCFGVFLRLVGLFVLTVLISLSIPSSENSKAAMYSCAWRWWGRNPKSCLYGKRLVETITVSGLLIFYCFRPNRSIKLTRCSSGTFLVTFSAYWSLSQVPSVTNWGFGINQSWGSWRESEEGVLSSSHGCGTLINGWLADCCCSKGGVYLLCGVACSFAFQGGHWDWEGSFNVVFFFFF